jgi:Predicted nucleotide-binding protein containing TIR-like domain
MATPKIFIASSGRTLELAKQLRAQLNPDYCVADLWTEVSQRRAGESILAMLKEAAKEYDFAVIILAQDDVMVTNMGETRKARDNCVFEAGLFTGVIGERRCLLLSSVKASDLPSDLGGIIYLSFKEPADLNDQGECQRAIVTPATRIESLVREPQEPIRNRPLTPERLLEREKSTYEGGDLFMDQVVVASVQPLDVHRYGIALQIKNNIDKYNIDYIYFFQGNEDGVMKTCQLLQLLLLSNFITSQKDADDWQLRLRKLAENQLNIKGNLEKMCKEDKIKIFFLASPPEFQYCIHNARSDRSATLYLKHGEEYIEWEKPAWDFWAQVRLARGAVAPNPPHAVFYGVPGFNIKEGSFSNILKTEVERCFPGISPDVMKLCLEGPG